MPPIPESSSNEILSSASITTSTSTSTVNPYPYPFPAYFPIKPNPPYIPIKPYPYPPHYTVNPVPVVPTISANPFPVDPPIFVNPFPVNLPIPTNPFPIFTFIPFPEKLSSLSPISTTKKTRPSTTRIIRTSTVSRSSRRPRPTPSFIRPAELRRRFCPYLKTTRLRPYGIRY